MGPSERVAGATCAGVFLHIANPSSSRILLSARRAGIVPSDAFSTPSKVSDSPSIFNSCVGSRPTRSDSSSEVSCPVWLQRDVMSKEACPGSSVKSEKQSATLTTKTGSSGMSWEASRRHFLRVILKPRAVRAVSSPKVMAVPWYRSSIVLR
jgi:hypothetical protein